MFKFFYLVNRKGIITFCGSELNKIIFDINGPSGKLAFRQHEDGYYKNGKIIYTKHPNIVISVLIGKKGWGLWKDEWSKGIAECNFTKEEILSEFKNIEIPEVFLKELDDFIYKERLKRYETKC